MTVFLQLVLVLAIILVSAKLAGYLAVRLGQPSVLGELLAGLLLGPSLLNLTHLGFITDAHLEETITQIGELGVLLLMFLAGLELHLSELAKNTRVSAIAGSLGVLVPVAFGRGLGLLFGMTSESALFMGLTMGATSVSISAQTLIELNKLRSRVGLGLLGAAVFDDILVILLLSTFLSIVSGSGGLVGVLLIFGRMLLFLALSVGFGLWVLPVLSRIVARLPISQGAVTLALVIMLVYGLAAELVGGMAAITGTFIAGLMFARTPEKKRIEPGLHAVAYSFFVPVFFITIGLAVNVRELGVEAIWMLLAISVMAIVGKLFGAGLGAKLGGFTNREALQLGAGMVSRGEVGLIVASIGTNQGLVSPDEFSAVVGMVLVTTLITPPLLRSLFSGSKPVPAPDDLPKVEAFDVEEAIQPDDGESANMEEAK
jgi:Kef-type K+ transport system membrane component KefB